MLQFIQIVEVFLVFGSFFFNSLKLFRRSKIWMLVDFMFFSAKKIRKYEWRIGMVFSGISHQEGLYLTSD